MRNNGRTLSREELHELIWSMPTTKLAKALGISDVGLGKICKRLEVPKPPLGYWRKVEAGGRLPKKPQLKKLGPKGQQQATIYPTPPESQSMQTIRKAEYLPCPTSLIDPHRLTARTLASFDQSKTDERGVLRSKNKVYLDLKVTQECLHRACLIMDTLIKALEPQGYKVKTNGDHKQKTLIEFEGMNITISLEEKIRRTDHKPTPEDAKKYKQHLWMIPRFDHIPTGILSLRIHDWAAPRKIWSDGKRQRLENCLGSFIQGLQETAKQMIANDEQRRLDEIRWEEERRQREERERLARIHARKVDKLMSDCEKWHKAEQLRGYTARMEALPEGNEELSEWITWAKSYIEKIDPLNNPADIPFILNEHSSYY